MAHNPGTAFDLDWIRRISLDDERVESRSLRYTDASIPTDAPGETDAVALTTAVRCLDLTSLGNDTSASQIDTLCAEAQAPLAAVSASEALGSAAVAAVCVYPSSVAAVVTALGDSSIPVAAACGFPDARDPLRRVGEIRQAAASGAREVDAVIDRELILGAEWAALYDSVRTLREASAGLLLKVILRTGTLPTSSDIVRAGLTCAMAGADFLKTSTGMDSVNATAPAGIALSDAIRAYRERTGHRVGLKPAGGLRTASGALSWLRLARGELGEEWIEPGLFRLGASSLLGALRSRLNAPASQ